MYRQKGKRVISVLICALAAILILAGCATSQQRAVNKPVQAKIKYSANKGDILAIINTAEGIQKNGKNTVVVMNQKTHELLAVQETDQPNGYHSHGLGATPILDKIYMPSFRPPEMKNSPDPMYMYVLDSKTMETLKKIDVGYATHHVDYGKGDIFATVMDGFLLRVDSKTDAVKAKIGPLNGSPVSTRITPDGNFAYVTVNRVAQAPDAPSGKNGWVAKIDLKTNKQVGTIEVGDAPEMLDITKDGKKLYVVNDKSQDISVIDTITDKVIQTIKDPKIQLPYGITLSPDEKFIYITSKYAGFKVQQIDLSTGEITKELPTGSLPDHLRITPDGKELWVPINGTNEVEIIDLATFRRIESVKLPGDAHEVTFVEVPETFQADPSLSKPYINVSFEYKYEAKSGGEAKANAAQTPTADEKLYQQRCSVCHSAPDPKDPTNLANFERMADVAKLTPSEKETLLSYIKKSQKQ